MPRRTAEWTPPFLTLVDPEIAVKGSLDPLGLTPLWSRFGRALVGNLTTVTTSVRGFTTLLLGHYLARKIINDEGGSEEELIEHFIRLEQLAAYARHAYAEETGDSPNGIRGIQRVRKRWSDGGGRVPIASGRDGQILSNQKAYGLWNLYSAAARESGLLEKGTIRLTREAELFVRKVVLRRLGASGLRDERPILDLVRRDGDFQPLGRHRKVGRALARMHVPQFDQEERSFWIAHLLHGGPSSPEGRQERLWRVLDEVNQSGASSWKHSFGIGEIRSCVAAAKHADEELADLLERIRRFENVIAPCRRAFTYLQGCDGRDIDDVVADLRSAWGRGLGHIEVDAVCEHLEPVAEVQGSDGVDRFSRFAATLHDGRFSEFLSALLEQNQEVMERRGGGPWIALEQGAVKVRYRSETGDLPAFPELESLWTSSYFIDSVKSIGAELYERHSETPDV